VIGIGHPKPFLSALFVPPDYATCFAALSAAQRFLVASEIAFRPAALIFHFGFAVTTA
jgi:hypothetical protein